MQVNTGPAVEQNKSDQLLKQVKSLEKEIEVIQKLLEVPNRERGKTLWSATGGFREIKMWTGLQSKGWNVMRELVSKIRKLEEAGIQKSENREEKKLQELQRTRGRSMAQRADCGREMDPTPRAATATEVTKQNG